MRELKRESSLWVSREIGESNFAWQPGYGAFSVSPGSLDGVVAYIKHQEEHHKSKDSLEEFTATPKFGRRPPRPKPPRIARIRRMLDISPGSSAATTRVVSAMKPLRPTTFPNHTSRHLRPESGSRIHQRLDLIRIHRDRFHEIDVFDPRRSRCCFPIGYQSIRLECRSRVRR